MDMGSIVGKVTTPIIGFFSVLLKFTFGSLLVAALLFFGFFFLKYHFNPFRLNADKLRKPYIPFKYYDLLRWILVDFIEREKHKGEFREYGFTFYTGRQGAGKTASMVHRLDVIKERYPKCLVVTNFAYYRADYIMQDWRDIMTIRNGTDGVLFAIDEIHSEYSAASWKDVPEDLLSEVSQQRKQRVKILATAQYFTRVAKPLREQASTVIACTTFAGRLTKNREYDALDFATIVDNPNVATKKLRPISKSSFVQSDAFRACYDTYEKIKRMRKTKFIPRNERGL